jgi:hypothetical protein
MRNKISIYILSLFLAIACSTTLASCTLETGGNGKLDGFWHLVSIDTLSNGNVSDLSESRVFWGVEGKLINVKNIDTNSGGFYFRFAQTSDSLVLKEPYANHWHEDGTTEGGDIPVTDASVVVPYGINGLEDHFLIEALSSGKMILKSNTLRLKFKKL